MRKFTLTLGLAALALAACSPQTLTFRVDMRHPSKSGIDLSRKTMSIVYMDNGQADTTFSNGVASSLARSLEEDYFAGNEAVGVYKIPADSVSLDLMHRLVIDSGDDVIFLLGPPAFGELALSDPVPVKNPVSVDSAFVSQAQLPYNAKIFVYDSMDKEDQLHIFRGNSVLRSQLFTNGVTAKEFLKEKALQAKDWGAELVGKQISNRFVPTWKEEDFSLFYFDGWDSEDWVLAASYAYEMKWRQAADIWMKKIGENSYTKRACACYNTALAFFMMGDLDLATKWLDRSDQYGETDLSPALRKRIQARKK